MQTVSTCQWFDKESQDAAALHVDIFPNSRVLDTKYILEDGPAPAGSVLTVRFSPDGTEFTALNGGPHFAFSPATSLVVARDTDDEVDTLSRKLTEGGQESRCGWLTDRFGVLWQVVPRRLMAFLNTADRDASQRAFTALLWSPGSFDPRDRPFVPSTAADIAAALTHRRICWRPTSGSPRKCGGEVNL